MQRRGYAGERDLEAMLGLLAAVRPAERVADYPSPADLREALALKGVQENTRLWFDAQGRLVGFAYVDHYHNLHWELDGPFALAQADRLGLPRRYGPLRGSKTPQTGQAAHAGIESEMVDWGVECMQRAMREAGQSLTLDASCREDDAERIAMLRRHGFALQPTRSLHMRRPLDEPIPAPRLPPGFRMRPVAGKHETGAQSSDVPRQGVLAPQGGERPTCSVGIEALVALHRAAFGSENMTVEERTAMMSGPEYDPELDLLIVAPDGSLAANCLCSIYPEENARSGRLEGYTDPVVTHPDFQRRGLARALLLAGMAKLRERGMQAAVLGTSSENAAMRRAAESAGFRVHSTTLWFSRQVEEPHTKPPRHEVAHEPGARHRT